MHYCIAVILLFASQNAWAGREAREAAIPLTNSEAALAAIASNPPLPMTYFKKGDYKMTVMLNGFSLRTAAVPNDALADIEMDGYANGYGGGVLYDKAISDRWSVFGLVLGAHLRETTLVGNAENEVNNSDTLFQSSRGDSGTSISAALGINRRLLGKREDGFLLTGFFGPMMFYTSGSGRVHLLNNKTAPNSEICHQKFPGYNCIMRTYKANLLDVGFMAGLQGVVPLGKSFAVNPYLIFLPGTYLFESKDKTQVNLNEPITFTTPNGRTTTSQIALHRGISYISLGANLQYRPWSVNLNLTGSLVTPLLASVANLDTYKIWKLQISRSFGTFKKKKETSVDISR